MKRLLLLFVAALGCGERPAIPDDARGVARTSDSDGLAAVGASGRLSLSFSFGCAVTPAQAIMCWGVVPGDRIGLLEDQDAPTVPRRIDAPAGLRFRAVAAGWDHACALSTAGDVWCWGDTGYGQLGRGSVVDASKVPVRVPGLDSVRQIAAGMQHTCALVASGAVWCWGRNYQYQLGVTDSASSPIPVRVSTDKRFADLVVSSAGNCAITAEGTSYCWGVTGVGRAQTATPMPTVPDARQLAVSDSHACALSGDAAIHCWGRNRYGVVGGGPAVRLDAQVTAPLTIGMPEPITNIAVGPASSCALGASGQAYCWGFTGPSSALGVQGGDTLCVVRAPQSHCVRAPRPVITELRFRELVIGHAEGWRCGLTTDDRLACWGQMSYEVAEAPRPQPTIIPWIDAP